MEQENYIQEKNSSIKVIELIITILFFLPILCFSQKNVSTYSLSYFEKTYPIDVSEVTNDVFSIFIGIDSKGSKTASFEILSTEVENLKKSLIQIKEKYIEWSNIAKENNVKDMSKVMDINLPEMTVCWYSLKWYFSFKNILQPRFIILNDGRHILSFSKEFTASSNQYVKETIYWVFSNAKEIDDFIAQLDINKIKNKLMESKNSADLFK